MKEEFIMKKTLVSALTTALVVGAASTTFAAANPFSDVPADHWAYDAVTQLAQDGVIEGYGDNSFRGDRNITRYEMAQIVAKAMAKTDVSAADKAMIDKLAAEFADELGSLGVRVANLERNADMVKWNGEARYTVARDRHESRADDSADDVNEALLRLEPSAEINSNWHVKSRIDAKVNVAEDEGDDGNLSLKRLWAQGDYKNFTAKIGKFAPIDNDSIFDTNFSGAEVSFGSKTKLTLGAGRLHTDDGDAFDSYGYKEAAGLDVTKSVDTDAANYYYAGLGYANGKFDIGADYHRLNLRGNDNTTKDLDLTNNINLWLLKTNYRFDNNNALGGFYAKSNWKDYNDNTGERVADKAWSVEYDYKGAQQENAGTWGAWLAYRYLGAGADFYNTFDAVRANEKAWEVGANYTFTKNVVGQVRYARGSQINGATGDNDGVSSIFGRVEFFF